MLRSEQIGSKDRAASPTSVMHRRRRRGQYRASHWRCGAILRKIGPGGDDLLGIEVHVFIDSPRTSSIGMASA
eukprot:6187373-Pyramimonas_sp.AAC.1